MERARAWAEAKVKDKADISGVNTEAQETAREESKARVREKNNVVQRSASEASVKIRAKAEAERSKRDRE